MNSRSDMMLLEATAQVIYIGEFLKQAHTNNIIDFFRNRWMRFDVLWPWLQHASVHKNVAVQMQISLVLSRTLWDVYGTYRGIHVQVATTHDVYILQKEHLQKHLQKLQYLSTISSKWTILFSRTRDEKRLINLQIIQNYCIVYH